MNVYVIFEKETDELISIYKNEDSALKCANEKGAGEQMAELFGGKPLNRYRVEVVEVIE